VEHLARVDRILSFFPQGDIAPDMSEGDIEPCKSVEQKMRGANRAIGRSHKAAVEFIDENGGGPGVRLRKPVRGKSGK
jgi:hypothetical protein